MVLAACGPASTPAPFSENPDAVEVQITLTEFAVESSVTDFKAGVPYTFTIKNAGNAAHEWLIMPRGETGKAKALVAVGRDRLERGATATATVTFTEAREPEMSCHIVRHYENGMVIPITVN